jgi:hypothetical protein
VNSVRSGSRSWTIGIIGILLTSLAGCASHVDGNLHLVSADKKHDFCQAFTEAYLTRTETGDVDILLEQDGLNLSRHDDPEKPLAPDAYLTPRQFVHVRVFWKPLSQKADHPAATNASIEWYLLGDGPSDGNLIEYSGPALVALDDSQGVCVVKVQNAWLKVVLQRGCMCDPLGPSQMRGAVRAIVDPQRFDTLLSELKAATTPSTPEVSVVPGQPPHASIDP